ncbi:uncharacterized protein cd8b [Melanotaenia boesemani]|uniref:uncharacterized protein cd8b n=1 Tax=Melanotaenia boesemani TaxID=1250792 RepID=UPI001C04D78E|nr:uncharacterized protein cd8b [Melanotaenia boesemani]
MIPLPLAWTLMAAQIWTYGSSQILHEPVNVLYPKISSSETLDCDCQNMACDNVFWFHTVPSKGKIQFIGKSNNADRVIYGKVDTNRYKLSKRGSSSFVLRIINVTEADAGIYSCVLKDTRTDTEKFRPGTLLRPGATPPTIPPTTKSQNSNRKPIPQGCRCNLKYPPVFCEYYVLWTLVGLLAALALAVLCILYYYSRLPKKCQHHFVKKRMMT